MLEYVYEQSQIKGTTGYFACIPSASDDILKFLDLLENRQLDNFLHYYLLVKLIALSPSSWQLLANRYLKTGSKALACIFYESTLFRNENLQEFKFLPDIISHWYRYSPSPSICVTLNDKLTNALRANISVHTPVAWNTLSRNSVLLKLIDDNKFPTLPPEELLKKLFADAYKVHVQTPAVETQRVPLSHTISGALEDLTAAGLLEGDEMRHEATLSPIALLRQWRLNFSVDSGSISHNVSGIATSYGRGLSLAGARASCLMEIVERASAHAIFECNQSGNHIHNKKFPHDLIYSTKSELIDRGISCYHPFITPEIHIDKIPLYWIAGTTSDNLKVFVPCQAVYMFCNLNEPAIFDFIGSTGIASGNTYEEAKLSALLEVIERHANAVMPYIEEDCFRLKSRDHLLNELFTDYHLKNIYVQFQDISIGIPVYRCFVQGMKGNIAQATGASLSGQKAALSALTETPWPYSWSAPFSSSERTASNSHLPVRYLEDLPEFSFPSAASSLEFLELILAKIGIKPIYVDISRADLRFPVVRAFIPEFYYSADFDEVNLPPASLLQRIHNKSST